MAQVSGRPTPHRLPPPPPLLSDGTEGASPSRTRPVVLLVDDIEDCRDVYGQFLRHAGYEVVEAADGYEALAKAAALLPDAIVMDLWMPHLDGWESIRQLKASPTMGRIPVLVLTGDAYAQARRDAEDAGCEAYLVKPCLPPDVAAEVGRLIAATRSGSAHSGVKVMSERRSGGRRQSATEGGVLASVVAEIDRCQQELSGDLRSLEDAVQHVAGAEQVRLQRCLERAEETRQALARRIESLKIVARTTDVKIAIPSRRSARE